METTNGLETNGNGPAVERVPSASWGSTPVKAIMTLEVLTIRSDLGLDTLAEWMLERGISGAPVVDEDGSLVGVVSKTDLVRGRQEGGEEGDKELGRWSGAYEGAGAFHLHEEPRQTVADIMSKPVVSVPETATLSQAAAVMAEANVHRVVVVGESDRVVGIVSSMDVLRWVAREP